MYVGIVPFQGARREEENGATMTLDIRSSFRWNDPFLLSDQLSEDERMIRDTAHAYAQEKLQPRVIEAYLNEKTDPSIFREMGELRLLGVTVPDEYGGVGASLVSYGL